MLENIYVYTTTQFIKKKRKKNQSRLRGTNQPVPEKDAVHCSREGGGREGTGGKGR